MRLKTTKLAGLDPILTTAAKYSYAGAWLCVAGMFLVHFYYGIIYQAPRLGPTTGCEEEDLFSVWKFVQGLPVYTDPLQAPYTASCYNFGYYALYGFVAKLVMATFSINAVWLPTICRLTSLALGLIGCVLFFLALRFSDRAWRFWAPLLLILFCFAPVFEPICGMWAFTTRPDVGARTFELAGLILILRYLETRHFLLPFMAALAFYAAWSFKQANLSALGGVCLSLLILGQWRALLELAGLWSSLVAATLVIGGPVYRYNIIGLQLHFPLILSQELGFFFWALVRDPFIPMLMIIMGYMCWKAPASIFRRPLELTLLLTSLVALLLVVATIGKTGSDINYFIPFATWAFLWFLFAADRVPARLLHATQIVFSCLMILKVGFYFSHGLEVPASTAYQDLSQKLATLPAPILVSERGGNLPWIQSKPPYFVIPYSYDYETAAGIKHEYGGWEGLMKEGYFNTVAVDRGYPLPADLLTRYKLASEDRSYRYYQRVP